MISLRIIRLVILELRREGHVQVQVWKEVIFLVNHKYDIDMIMYD